MARAARVGTILLLMLAVGWEAAAAADHVVAGTQLRLRRTAKGGAMTLVLRDVTAIPEPGSSDDPSVAGLTVTLFGFASGQQAGLSAAPGVGQPGWKVRSAPRVAYRYADPSASPGSAMLASAILRSGSGLRVRARSAGLDLSDAEGVVAVRVEWGTERVCTLFDGDAVRRDRAGIFLGKGADVPLIANCDDESLLTAACTDDGVSCSGVCPGDSLCGGNFIAGCRCVSPHQPCGDSAPVCNGECPAGETCGVTFGGPFATCGCLPASSTPCGDAFPSCDTGDCPAGTSCYPHTIFAGRPFEIHVCGCSSEPPTDPCGGCPEGWSCIGPGPGFPPTCLPPFCSGGSGFPICNGSCADPNTTCTALGGCFCLELCSGGSPAPVCGGTCATPGASCVAVDDLCLCAPPS